MGLLGLIDGGGVSGLPTEYSAVTWHEQGPLCSCLWNQPVDPDRHSTEKEDDGRLVQSSNVLNQFELLAWQGVACLRVPSVNAFTVGDFDVQAKRKDDDVGTTYSCTDFLLVH